MNKEFFDKVKSTMNTAADTISTVAQTFVEKNRTKAKLNRLRMVMKSESELMNRAYIALGKEYYEMLKKGDVVAAVKSRRTLSRSSTKARRRLQERANATEAFSSSRTSSSTPLPPL